jgi:hypothetical protein
LSNKAIDADPICYVHLRAERADPDRLHLRDDARKSHFTDWILGLQIQVRNGHVGSECGKPECVGAPHSATGSSHQRDLSGQVSV